MIIECIALKTGRKALSLSNPVSPNQKKTEVRPATTARLMPYMKLISIRNVALIFFKKETRETRSGPPTRERRIQTAKPRNQCTNTCRRKYIMRVPKSRSSLTPPVRRWLWLWRWLWNKSHKLNNLKIATFKLEIKSHSRAAWTVAPGRSIGDDAMTFVNIVCNMRKVYWFSDHCWCSTSRQQEYDSDDQVNCVA